MFLFCLYVTYADVINKTTHHIIHIYITCDCACVKSRVHYENQRSRNDTVKLANAYTAPHFFNIFKFHMQYSYNAYCSI